MSNNVDKNLFISLKVLRNSFLKIMNDFEEKGLSEVEISKDFYWEIPNDERYNPYLEPKTFTLGQLDSDIEELQGIDNGDKELSSLSLKSLAAVLKYIGEDS